MEVGAGSEARARATVCTRKEEKWAPEKDTEKKAHGEEMEPKKKEKEM